MATPRGVVYFIDNADSAVTAVTGRCKMKADVKAALVVRLLKRIVDRDGCGRGVSGNW